MSKEKEIAYEFLENHLGSHITRSFSYTNPGIFESTINAVTQLQKERDSLKEQLESCQKSLLDVSRGAVEYERENKELKEQLRGKQIDLEIWKGCYSDVRKHFNVPMGVDTVTHIKSQLSSLKEQADKLEGALEKIIGNINGIAEPFSLNVATEALSTFKQSKGK